MLLKNVQLYILCICTWWARRDSFIVSSYPVTCTEELHESDISEREVIPGSVHGPTEDADSDVSDVEDMGYCNTNRSQPIMSMTLRPVNKPRIIQLYNNTDKVSKLKVEARPGYSLLLLTMIFFRLSLLVLTVALTLPTEAFTAICLFWRQPPEGDNTQEDSSIYVQYRRFWNRLGF